MAKQITNTGSSLLADQVNTHNSVLEVHRAAFTHADGPEYNVAGDLLGPAASGPSTFADCLTFQNSGKLWWNTWHLPLYGTGQAHKVADASNVIVAADVATSASFIATWLAAAIVGATEMTTDYVAHIANTGGAFHTNPDTANILGSTGTLTTASNVAERLNLLKGLHNDHIILETLGGNAVHGATGAADVVTTPNATENDWDSIIALHNALKIKIPAHFARGAAIHPGGADARTIAAPALTYPGSLFAMIIEWKTRVNAHFPSTTYHGVADEATLAYGDPTTVATLVSATGLLYTALRAHFFAGPAAGKALGLRLVA